MAMNYRELGKQAPEKDKVGAKLMSDFAEALRRQGILSDHWPTDQKSQPREMLVVPDLEAIWNKQVNRLVELGFHKVLGEYEESYRRSLPKLSSQPENYKGRFDIPLLVDPRVTLKEQYRLAGIREYIDIDKIFNVTPVPDEPYTLWTHDASRYRRYSVEQSIKHFAKDEVGSPQLEVTGLYLQHPELFRNYGVDAAGSHRDGRVPYLGAFDGLPRVDARWIDDPFRRWGALSRGKEIKLGS